MQIDSGEAAGRVFGAPNDTSKVTKEDIDKALLEAAESLELSQQQIEEGKDVNIEFQGYGFSIPSNVMENLLQSISENLLQGIKVTELEPKKNLRNKRMSIGLKESK